MWAVRWWSGTGIALRSGGRCNGGKWLRGGSGFWRDLGLEKHNMFLDSEGSIKIQKGYQKLETSKLFRLKNGETDQQDMAATARMGMLVRAATRSWTLASHRIPREWQNHLRCCSHCSSRVFLQRARDRYWDMSRFWRGPPEKHVREASLETCLFEKNGRPLKQKKKTKKKSEDSRDLFFVFGESQGVRVTTIGPEQVFWLIRIVGWRHGGTPKEHREGF